MQTVSVTKFTGRVVIARWSTNAELSPGQWPITKKKDSNSCRKSFKFTSVKGTTQVDLVDRFLRQYLRLGSASK